MGLEVIPPDGRGRRRGRSERRWHGRMTGCAIPPLTGGTANLGCEWRGWTVTLVWTRFRATEQ